MAASVALVRSPWAARVVRAAMARFVDDSLAAAWSVIFDLVVVADPDGDELWQG
jgi:hypothetical protein